MRRAVTAPNVTSPINVKNSSQSNLISLSLTVLHGLSEVVTENFFFSSSPLSHAPLVPPPHLCPSVHLSVCLWGFIVCQCSEQLSLFTSPNRLAHLCSCFYLSHPPFVLKILSSLCMDNLSAHY